MRKGKMYVTRTGHRSRRKLPLWLYNIRWRLARWITPPYLTADIILPFDENIANICIDDGETGRPFFEAVPVYLRRPSWSRWNTQTSCESPCAPTDPKA